MLRKVLVLGLAFIVLWSGLATQESSFAPASAHAAIAPDPAAPNGPGSVADHHLDDQPAQHLTEGAIDLPALVSGDRPTRGPDPSGEAPAERARLARAPPFLAGPLRPPSVVHAIDI